MEKGGHTKQPKQGGPTTPGPAAAEAAKGRSIGCATELVWAVLKTALALAAFRQLLQSTLPTQERWDGWHAQWESEFLFFMVLAHSAHFVAFVGLNLALLALAPLLEPYRLQSGTNSPDLLWNCAKLVVFNNAVVQPIMIGSGYPMFETVGIVIAGPVPSPLEVMATIAGCVVVEDTAFYWAHRTLHRPELYKRIHKIHHDFKMPNGFAAEYAHPVEHTLANLFPLFAGPILIALTTGRCHLVSILVWTMFRVCESVDGHCGYNLPFSPFGLFPGRPNSFEHDWHHSRNAGNFASFFTFWDDAMGTSREAVHARLKAKAK